MRILSKIGAISFVVLIILGASSCDDDSSSSNGGARIVYYSTLVGESRKSSLAFFTTGAFSYKPPIGEGSSVFTKNGSFSGSPTTDGAELALHVTVVSNVESVTPYDITAKVSGTTITVTDEGQSIKLYKNGIETRLISFDLGEGATDTGAAIASIEAQANVAVDLPTTALVCEGKTFLGWAESERETDFDKIYSPGSSYTISVGVGEAFSDVTLHAIFSETEPLKYKIGSSGAEAALTDISLFNFSSAGEYIFSGLIDKATFSAIMGKLQEATADVSVDFSACEGMKFTCDEGTAVNSLCGVVARGQTVAHLVAFKAPPPLIKIPSYAFYNCTKLTTLALSKEIKSIGDHIIEGSAVEAITVEAGNANFSVGVNGELLSEGGEVLSLFPFVTSATSYTTPATVKRIYQNAFLLKNPCTITSFTLTDAVTTVGANCAPKSVASLTLGAGLKEIGWGAFSSLEALTTVTIPPATEKIGEDAFSGCTNLATVTLSEGLLEIGSRAFDSTAVTALAIPKSVTKIADYAFNNCERLASITVAADSSAYKSDNGVLYSIGEGDALTLVKYPAKKTGDAYTVLAGSSEIKAGAFLGAADLKEVCIRSSVKKIDAPTWQFSPFLNCDKTLSIKLAYSKASVPSTFGAAWSLYKDGGALTVTYDYVVPVEE